ncbi:hypothetical protein P879_10396 [Paragonimus westermani]|uniref:Uncharacterized protein n=1 Tax=Paragonimus westermani TaxID=34504 RepID=A0A8T0DEN5_9TREM|nr:hypothetical protein P879_10396 [Paragonimus westermani]
MAIPCVVPGRPVHVKACITSQGLTIDGQLICPDCRLLCDPTECPSLPPEYSHPLIVRPASFSRRPVKTHPNPFQGLYPVNDLALNITNETIDTYFKQSSTLYRKTLYSLQLLTRFQSAVSSESLIKSVGVKIMEVIKSNWDKRVSASGFQYFACNSNACFCIDTPTMQGHQYCSLRERSGHVVSRYELRVKFNPKEHPFPSGTFVWKDPDRTAIV